MADLGATVYFSQSSYSIAETEGVIQICASISVWTDFNISVGIESESITANGKYEQENQLWANIYSYKSLGMYTMSFVFASKLFTLYSEEIHYQNYNAMIHLTY